MPVILNINSHASTNSTVVLLNLAKKDFVEVSNLIFYYKISCNGWSDCGPRPFLIIHDSNFMIYVSFSMLPLDAWIP